jgi:hypothetical protein
MTARAKRARAPSRPPKRPPVELDRVVDTQTQIAEIDRMIDEIGTRDVQGVARLMGTRRGLVADLHVELAARQQADASGDASVLEGRLVESLVAMDAARLARVLRETAKRLGVELSAWAAAT